MAPVTKWLYIGWIMMEMLWTRLWTDWIDGNVVDRLDYDDTCKKQKQKH